MSDAPMKTSSGLSRRSLFFTVLTAVLFVIPVIPGIPVYWITLLDNIGLAALVAIGLILLTGVGGMTSFGQATFCGFAAYTTAVLCAYHGFSPWISLFFAVGVTLIAAVILGIITVPLSGHYLPLGTLAWGIAIYYLFSKLDFLGRNDGITPVPPISLAGYQFFDSRSIFYVIWTFVIIAVLTTTNLLDSRTGRAIRALRGASGAAESFGVDTTRTKLIVFVYAALLAAISGWLYAHVQRAVNPTPFGVGASIEYLFMAVAGGTGHPAAAIFGAAFVTFLKEILTRLLPFMFGGQTHFQDVVFGIVLVLILQKSRQGLWPLVERVLPQPANPVIDLKAEPLPVRTRPEPGTKILELDTVRKQFQGLVAVNDVSFSIKAGEIVGLIGPNGAGKSTTFNLVTGTLPLTSGKIEFRGEQIAGLTPRQIAARGIGRTFQHVKVLPEMSVLDNVALGAHLRGSAGVAAASLRLDRQEEARILAEAAKQIERVGLGEHMHKQAGSLALGQLRILEIARALCLDPTLLLLDEPAAGLRHFEKQQLSELLRQLRNEGMTVLLVEHDMGFVMNLTDHLVVLDFGTKIAEGTPAVVSKHPAVIQAYLGADA